MRISDWSSDVCSSDLAAYVPVDISGDFLRDSAEGLAARFPGLAIYPVDADFTQRIELPREICPLPKLGFFPGSTIGNMVALTAIDLLRTRREALGAVSLTLIGAARIKDVAVSQCPDDGQAGAARGAAPQPPGPTKPN